MRKIKFRVWCHKTQRLYSFVDRIDWLLSGHLIRANSVISEIETHHMHNDYEDLLNRDEVNFELSQFIGIKDINDVEIFEEDYCRVSIPCSRMFNDNSCIKILAKVFYDDESCAFKLKWIDTTGEDREKYDDVLTIDEYLKLEVIGNRYQTDLDILKKALYRQDRIDEILE